ncbi:TrkH family potassium uptake protein [bacterium]|nr:TrkH family potassium uptake protein [bacterium]
MKTTITTYYIGFILAMVGIFMLISAMVGFLYHDGSGSILLVTGFLIIGIGLFPMIFIPRKQRLTIREAIFIVAGSWLVINFAGAIPFYLYGTPFTITNAIFESFSGFTTTGATILEKIEIIPKGLLFWRSMTHWIGGIGIIVFALSILPTMGHVSRSLFRQEYTGLASPPSFPRAKDIARVVVLVYVGLTALESLLLMVAGVSIFESVTTAFGTIATGGFSPRDNSIAAYNSISVEMIVLVFMVISGINFAFLYSLLFKRRAKLFGGETIRFYLVLLLVSTLITVASIKGFNYLRWGEAFRYGIFQVVSVGTSTGFATADSSVWRPSAQLILVFLALICATAGSTSGGIKVDRIVLFAKLVNIRIKQVIHPNIVTAVRIENQMIQLEFADKAMFFIVFYLFIVITATLMITLTGVKVIEAFTGSVACMGNVGPGLGKVGSMGNYNSVPDTAKYILSAVMLIGRLEIFGLLLPLTPEFWRK